LTIGLSGADAPRLHKSFVVISHDHPLRIFCQSSRNLSSPSIASVDGAWQQVVFAEFDNRPRQRQVIVQILGE